MKEFFKCLAGRKRIFAVGFISMLLLLLFVSPGFAQTGKKNLEASYNNIKLVINGKIVVPKDVNGTIVEPFIYNGTTYLPVRAVSEALDKNVDWDGATQTVYVTDKTTANNQQKQDQPQTPTPTQLETLTEEQTQADTQPPAQSTTETPTQSPTQPPTQTSEPAKTVKSEADSITVYVSKSSSTIHSVSDCSGMKNYSTMTLTEARAISSAYCSRCATHLRDVE
jgi:hypothetical protein